MGDPSPFTGTCSVGSSPPGPQSRLDVSILDPAVLHYCEKGLADSTHKTYNAAIKRFLSFCQLFNVQSPFPVSESTLCYFVAALAKQGLAPGTIKTYLAAVRHAQIMRGLPEPRQGSFLPRLRLLQSGVRRDRAQQGLPPARSCLPITPNILLRIYANWSGALRATEFDTVMIWSTMVTCFFGFFRAGELTVPTEASFDSTAHLAWGDVAVDEASPPSMVRVFLKRSKADQFGQGVAVFLGTSSNALCPVSAILAYVARRGDTPGVFFRFQSGSPLTKTRFVARVRSALLEVGIPYQNYSGHSFRIGAATAAAQAGLQDSTIQALGRWSSAAFLTYIRTPRDHLAQFSRTIAGLPASET